LCQHKVEDLSSTPSPGNDKKASHLIAQPFFPARVSNDLTPSCYSVKLECDYLSRPLVLIPPSSLIPNKQSNRGITYDQIVMNVANELLIDMMNYRDL